MKRIFKLFTAAMAALLVANAALAGPISLMTGPVDPSAVQASFNGLINSINLQSSNAGAGNLSTAINIPTVANIANSIQITPAATGTAPSIATLGDANRNLSIAGSGTGIVILGQAICTVTGTTPQTCNGQRGIVTTGTLTTAAVTNAAYVINNSSVAATSLIMCTDQGYSGTLVTNGEPILMTCVPGSGTITVNITNVHAANALNGTVQIGFTVLN